SAFRRHPDWPRIGSCRRTGRRCADRGTGDCKTALSRGGCKLTALRKFFVRPAGRGSRSPLQTIALYAAVGVFALWVLLPVWYLVVSSLITPQQLGSRSFSYFPS